MQQKPVSLERVQQNGRSGGFPQNAIYHSARRSVVPHDSRQIVFEVSLTNSRRDIGVETRETKRRSRQCRVQQPSFRTGRGSVGRADGVALGVIAVH